MHIDAVKEFYASLTLVHYKKKDVARSRVRVPRFGKRDTTSYMDIIYIDHLISRRSVNLPRVMMRHMSYVISMKVHELPYGDYLTMVFEAFDVPLIDKQGEEPKRYDYFEETFLTMCQLRRDNGVWWLEIGEHRRRDDEEATPAENEEVNEEEVEDQPDFDWEAVVDEAILQGESGSNYQFFDAQVEVEDPVAEAPAVPVFPASPGDSTNVLREPATSGVDPLIPTGSILDSIMIKLQVDFECARANRIQADL
ncbi:hypothetical protein Dimus_013398 [Dionaea muscipula]